MEPQSYLVMILLTAFVFAILLIALSSILAETVFRLFPALPGNLYAILKDFIIPLKNFNFGNWVYAGNEIVSFFQGMFPFSMLKSIPSTEKEIVKGQFETCYPENFTSDPEFADYKICNEITNTEIHLSTTLAGENRASFMYYNSEISNERKSLTIQKGRTRSILEYDLMFKYNEDGSIQVISGVPSVFQEMYDSIKSVYSFYHMQKESDPFYKRGGLSYELRMLINLSLPENPKISLKDFNEFLETTLKTTGTTTFSSDFKELQLSNCVETNLDDFKTISGVENSIIQTVKEENDNSDTGKICVSKDFITTTTEREHPDETQNFLNAFDETILGNNYLLIYYWDIQEGSQITNLQMCNGIAISSSEYSLYEATVDPIIICLTDDNE